jgi:hypothetical protein
VGVARFTYAGFGGLLSEDGPWESDTVSYTYDNGRRRNGLSVQAPNASPWSQTYGYDAANRLTYDGQKVLEYDDESQLTRLKPDTSSNWRRKALRWPRVVPVHFQQSSFLWKTTFQLFSI